MKIQWRREILVVGATHCVALKQQSRVRDEGEAVPRPYGHPRTATPIGVIGHALRAWRCGQIGGKAAGVAQAAGQRL